MKRHSNVSCIATAIVLSAGFCYGNGVLRISVQDSAGTPLQWSYVNVVRVGDSSGVLGSSAEDFGHTWNDLQQGDYFDFTLPPGIYIAQGVQGGYYSAWYDGKDDAVIADPVTVRDSQTTTVNIHLVRMPKSTHVNYSGSVSLRGPDSTHAPWAVYLYAIFGPSSPYAGTLWWAGETDDAGQFTFSGPAHEPFVLIAAGYYPYDNEFNNGSVAIEDAPWIYVNKDTSGIRLSISPIANPDRIVKGRVLRCDGLGFESWAVVTEYEVSGEFPVPVQTTFSDSAGTFWLWGGRTGKYILKATAIHNGWGTGYYRADGECESHWQNATQVHLGNDTTQGITIHVNDGLADTGAAAVRGSVRVVDTTGSGQGLKGATIMLRHSGDAPKLATSDAQGLFQMSDLPMGTYDVLLDKPGYKLIGTPTATVVYGAGVPVILSLDAKLVGTNPVQEMVVPRASVVRSITPNPAHEEAAVVVALREQSRVTIRVYDLVGRLVRTVLDSRLVSGMHTVPFATGSLPAGTYSMVLTAGGVQEARFFVVDR